MSVISKLKRANKDSELAKLKAKTEALDAKQQYKDDRYWQPVAGPDGNGSAIIRFLPGIQIEGTEDFEEPFVRYWHHSFKGPTGQWYIENSLTTLGQKDPMSDYNSKLWKTEDKELQDQVRNQKRKLTFVSNIYVVKHPSRPEDEGKVFLYKYGQKIFDKIKEKMIPPEDEPDLEPVNVFDFWEGANFRLRMKKVKGFNNYDDSTFDAPKPLLSDDAELEAIFEQEHSLLAEVATDKFKTYEELKKRMYEVLGLKDDEEGEEPPRSERKIPTATKPKSKVVVTESEDDEVPFDVDEDGVVTEKVVEKKASALSSSDFFKKLKAPKKD